MKNFLFIYRSHKNKPEQRSKILEAIDNNYCNHDFGFFLLSLKCVANVDFIFGVEELDNYLEKKYDVIFVDIKAIMQDGLDKDYLLSFRKKINTTICLFSGMDQVFTHLKNNKVSGAEVVDLLQPKLINFVNLFKDYNIYQLSPNHLDKLRPTFFSLGYSNIKYDLKNYSFKNFESLPKTNDIFFSGGLTVSTLREKVLEYINKNFYDLKKIIRVNSHLNIDEYITNIMQSKINLALPGNYNNISYRHNEIIFLKSLLLTDSSFKNFEISKYFSELNSFIFNNEKELNNLVYFYSHFDEEREKVVLRLNQQFTDFYSPKKQGEQIYNDLFH
jgi:hypothetical protein